MAESELIFSGNGSGSAYYNINGLSIRIDNPNKDSISYIDITFDAFISNGKGAGNVTIGFLIDGVYCTEQTYYISASTKNFSASIPFSDDIGSKNDSYYTLTFQIQTNKAGDVPYFLNVSYSDHGTLVTSYNNTIEYYVDGFEAGSDTQSGPDTSSSFTLFDLPDDVYTRDTSWESAFTITGKANGGVADTSCQAQLKEHYYCYYDGWFLNSIYGERVDPGETYTLSNGTALYATIDEGYEPEYKYNTLASLPKPTKNSDEVTYTVTFDPNGGSVNTTSKTATKTTTYVFDHWSSSAGGGTSYTNNKAFDKAATVYAQWAIGTVTTTEVTSFPPPSRSDDVTNYTITLNVNGGYCDITSLSSKKTISYPFKGWYNAKSGGSNYTKITPTKDITLYAQWNSTTTGPNAVTLPTPSKTNYAFGGWYDSSASKVYAAGKQITPTDDMSLTALWSASTYEVKYDGNGNTSGSMNNSIHTIGATEPGLSENKYKKEYTLSFDIGYSQNLLPNEYIQLDYVQSNYQQAIDTGYNFKSNNAIVEMEIENNMTDSIIAYGTRVFCGAEDATTPTFVGSIPVGMCGGLLTTNNSASSCCVQLGGGDISVDNSIPLNSLSNIIIRSTDLGDNNITCDFTVNETKNSVTGLAHFKNNVNYFIFANNNTGNAAIAENHSAFKLYSFKMTDNGILVRNFIPCKRKSDNIAGLYDLIGQQFYRSITGTDLTAGHEINSSGGSTSSEVIDDVIVSYTFNGWYSNPECNGDAITQAYNLTTAGKVYNVYAKWIQNSFTLPTPEREGYTFLGWYDSQGNPIVNNSYITSNLSLTAQWIKDEANKIIIYTNNDWKKAIALIYKNNTWKEYDFNIK